MLKPSPYFFVMVAIPSNRHHSPNFVMSLAALALYYGKEKIDIRIKLNCSDIAQARNEFVAEALRDGFTHLLFLDDDMVFPYDILDSLLGREMPVVAVNCKRKQIPATYTAIGMDGGRVSSDGKTGVEQVARVGAGILLIELAAIAEIPAPWFSFVWNKETGRMIGEDYFFCNLLRENDIPVMIDHDASRYCGHAGEYIY